MSNPKSDACMYILTGILQRMDAEKPGFIMDMIAGIKNDQSALPENIENKEHIESIFREALSVLERAHVLLEQSDNA